MHVLLKLSPFVLLTDVQSMIFYIFGKFIDKMILTNDCKLSNISSETLKYGMRMSRASPGDSTAFLQIQTGR